MKNYNLFETIKEIFGRIEVRDYSSYQKLYNETKKETLEWAHHMKGDVNHHFAEGKATVISSKLKLISRLFKAADILGGTDEDKWEYYYSIRNLFNDSRFTVYDLDWYDVESIVVLFMRFFYEGSQLEKDHTLFKTEFTLHNLCYCNQLVVEELNFVSENRFDLDGISLFLVEVLFNECPSRLKFLGNNEQAMFSDSIMESNKKTYTNYGDKYLFGRKIVLTE